MKNKPAVMHLLIELREVMILGGNSDARKPEPCTHFLVEWVDASEPWHSLEVECLRTYLKSSFSVLFVIHVLERFR